MSKLEEYKNVSELNGYIRFRNNGYFLLISFLSELLNCNVYIYDKKIEKFFETYKVNIIENEKRFCYRIDEDNMVLSVKVLVNHDIIAFMPIIITGKMIGKINSKILNQISSTITHILSDCYLNGFYKSQVLCGDSLIKLLIANCFSKGVLDTNNIIYLISYTETLCKTTFENNNFTTGFIISRSIYSYCGKGQENRFGEVIKLKKPCNLMKNSKIDKRFWYLVDGKSTFYLCDKSLKIDSMFIKDSENSDLDKYLDSYSLSENLYGNDVAFRVISSNQISILNAEGIEFVNVEGIWKLRDYKFIMEFIMEKVKISKEIVKSLLYYILYCSQNNISSIFWIPDDENIDVINKLLVSHNNYFRKHLSILNLNEITVLKRIISSDGVNIISKNGQLVQHGCIVDLSSVEASGLVGTGESATKLLSQNGVAIKVSQDGSIKIYYDLDSKPFIF